MSSKNWMRVLLIVSLLLMGIGLSMIYLPLCPLGLGLLIFTNILMSSAGDKK